MDKGGVGGARPLDYCIVPGLASPTPLDLWKVDIFGRLGGDVYMSDCISLS